MNNLRGSIWKKCDFHVHTPLSALANNFGDDFDNYVKTLFKNAIEKKIKIIGITDYFTIDGYKKIKQDYLGNPQKLKELFSDEEVAEIKNILLLPNVEFRLNKIVQINKINRDGKVKTESGRINLHVIFSDELSTNLIEENFLHDLDFVYESDPDESDKRKKLKTDNLSQLGRRLKSEQPDITGPDLQVGMTHAVVDDGKIGAILSENNDFRGKYLIVVPSDEDLSDIQWKSQDGLTRKTILQRAHAFFSSNANTNAFGLGDKSGSEEQFVKEFKTIKPCIWGSDAHDFDKLFEPDEQRYCWIKADATFEGIRQILFEPRDRVFIGEYPALFSRIKSARGNYINSISVNQINGYDERKGIWFKNFELQLGFELIAIIGNKGKGKSAIADIIGLLGNSHVNNKDFSFLNSDKFRQKGYAENFVGSMKWYDKTLYEKNLNENVDLTTVERVKYIPQSYLEKLCNNEDSGFKEEINKVVFLRLDDSDKLGKKSFDELESFKTELIAQQIDDLTLKLNSANRTIDLLEKKSSSDYKKGIENKRNIKTQELAAHEKEKDSIVVVTNPENDTTLSAEQRKKAEQVSLLERQITAQEALIESTTLELSNLKIRQSDLVNLSSDVLRQQQNIEEWKASKTALFSQYGLDINSIINLNVDVSKLQKLIQEANGSIKSTSDLLLADANALGAQNGLVVKLNRLRHEKTQLEKDLEKPFKDYQDYLVKIKEWETKQKAIVGNDVTDDTIKFYEKELNYVENELPSELTAQIELRKSIVINIYEQKKQIQEIYDKMKEAISEVLEEYSAEQNITIESSFKVDKQFYTQFFDYVNRYGHFYQGGDEELRKITAKYDFDNIERIKDFIDDLSSLDVRFKDNRKVDFYNYLCSLTYLRPEYDLRLNDKSLSQLSPGEKGGLLLVFYLVLDKDNKPLIIDQPEDNLDNQSVAEILVPYIKRAKKLRQIIMVTHNPNLAIVADAEQIVYMNIDKENNYVVSCDSGGIENPIMNGHIVDILEGRMKAFDNRRVKYKKYVSSNF